MKTIFITGLLLTLMVAPSLAQSLKIPNAMLGSWCAVDDGEEGLVRLSDMPLNSNGYPDCGGADYHVYVGRKDYGGHEVSCKARGITRHGDALQVRYRCNTHREHWWNETVRWQLVKNGTRLKFAVIKSTQ